MKPASPIPAGRPRGFYPAVGKRLLDLVLAGGTIGLFLPFWACLALLVRARMGSPVLFRQVRPGRTAGCSPSSSSVP